MDLPLPLSNLSSSFLSGSSPFFSRPGERRPTRAAAAAAHFFPTASPPTALRRAPKDTACGSLLGIYKLLLLPATVRLVFPRPTGAARSTATAQGRVAGGREVRSCWRWVTAAARLTGCSWSWSCAGVSRCHRSSMALQSRGCSRHGRVGIGVRPPVQE